MTCYGCPMRAMRLLLLGPLVLGACSAAPVSGGQDGGQDSALPPSDSAPPPADAEAPRVDAADAAPDAPPPNSTRGRGGVPCSSRGDLGAGRTYCVSAEGGSEYKLAEPSAGSGPLRLALFVHGDRAEDHRSDAAMRALLPWADAHRALFVSVLSPNKCAWWQLPTQTDCTDQGPLEPDVEGLNADALRAVIDRIRAGFDVTFGPMFYYGASGGSVFLTKAFLRRFGDLYPGAYALNCGGEKPDRPVAWPTSDPQRRGPTKLFFTYGERDFLKADIEVAIPFFAGLGLPTDTKVIAGAEHCAFDTHGRTAEVWSAFLGE